MLHEFLQIFFHARLAVSFPLFTGDRFLSALVAMLEDSHSFNCDMICKAYIRLDETVDPTLLTTYTANDTFHACFHTQWTTRAAISATIDAGNNTQIRTIG